MVWGVVYFLELSQSELLESLCARHQTIMGMRPDGLQMEAWRGEFEILRSVLGEIISRTPRAKDWAVIFQ